MMASRIVIVLAFILGISGMLIIQAAIYNLGHHSIAIDLLHISPIDNVVITILAS